MTDRYQTLVNSGPGRTVAMKLGLPRPAVLRRYEPGVALLPGPVLLVELTGSFLGLADVLRATGAELLAADDGHVRPTGLVVDATGLRQVGELAALPEHLGGLLRRLRGSGRVVVVGQESASDDGPELAAVRQSLDGAVRSLAKELRAGATANLVLAGAAGATPAALESTLRFLLSGRSAYVDGQVVRLAARDVPTAGDWSRPLAGKVALVTGAARGIGAAIAATLARDGATVVCADLPAAGAALAAVANSLGGSTLQLDIAAAEAPQRLARHLRERHGGVDIVVHNAGITRDRLLANMGPETWTSVLDVNLQAQLRINAVLLDGDLLRPEARIVSLSSTSGIAGNRGQTNYAASKAGIIGMVRATAGLLAPDGGTINAVAPGFIDTEMTQRMPLATREVARRLNSLNQAGQPVDVAEAVAWLASPGAGAVSAQVLRVCGQA
ncbi:MAG: 3-oxoacyl-ACP reductase, partial [bacterium]